MIEKMNDVRLLRADEIECRVGQVKKDGSGCSLLLYKDARVDMRVLDETVGPGNWMRSHRLVGNNLYCRVSIWSNELGMWIAKEDVGVESKTEKEKGEASDAFKRACFNWGIGRELYTAPFVWINYTEEEKGEASDAFKRACFNWGIGRELYTAPFVWINYTEEEKRGAFVKFRVADIAYDEKRNISRLVIVDTKGTPRYEWTKGGKRC